MLFVIIQDTETNITTIHSFNSYSDLIKTAFSPAALTLWSIDTNKPPKGKTYSIKKSCLRSKAINFSYIMGNVDNGISWNELISIQAYFYKYGKRYGLLKELRANGIC